MFRIYNGQREVIEESRGTKSGGEQGIPSDYMRLYLFQLNWEGVTYYNKNRLIDARITSNI